MADAIVTSEQMFKIREELLGRRIGYQAVMSLLTHEDGTILYVNTLKKVRRGINTDGKGIVKVLAELKFEYITIQFAGDNTPVWGYVIAVRDRKEALKVIASIM